MQGPLLPFEELSRALTARDDCERLTLMAAGAITDPRDGAPCSALYAFTRRVGDQLLDVPVAVYDDRMPVTSDLLDNILRRLKLDRADLDL